jgi:hypothetical protein
MKCKLLLSVLSSTFLFFTGCNLSDTTGTGVNTPYLYHIGELNSQGFAYSLAATDNTVYLADGLGGLRIIDISSPHFPQEMSYFEDNGTYYDLKFAGGDYIYVAAGEAGFKIIDVNSPFGPEISGHFSTDDSSFGLDYAGNFVYLADNTGGIRILDISSHFNIFEVSRIFVGGQNVNNVTLRWPYLYASCRYGFSVIDIENSYNPLEISFEDLPNVYDIDVVNHLAYVAFEGGLKIYDISQPDDPRELSSLLLPASARAIEVRGEFAYLALGRSGLSVVRIANSLQPYEVAYHSPVSAEMSGILLYGRYILIANGESGLLIMEFSGSI